MINGAHVLLYSSDPERDRAFFRDVLQFRSVDVGHGWLIFKLPPAELAVHPLDEEPGNTQHAMIGAHLYLMCDNLQELIKQLAARNVTCTEIATERWGIRTTIRLPSGGGIGLYQPTHPTALGL